LEPNSVLLAGGDEAVLPLLYLQAAEGHRPDVTLIIMPLLPGDWYVRQLRRRHPELNLTHARYDGRSGTLKALVEANRGRPVAMVGDPTDKSLQGSYWYYKRGLVALVKPLAEDVKLSEMVADNQRMLGRYRPPPPQAIKSKSFERGILTRYASAPFRLGEEFEKGRLYSEARVWYERALALDPNLSAAREAAARVARAR
jgi:hypothetical protein